MLRLKMMELASNNLHNQAGGYLEMPQPGARDRIIRPRRVQIERELEVLARLMDNQFAIPVLGWRFGLNAIIDLVPGIGDIATSLIAIYLLVSAVRYRVPKITLLRMGINIAIYFVVGMIPWIGDLFDAWWKPNIRNLRLLYSRATVSAAEARKGRASDWMFVGLIVGTLLLLLFASVALSAFVMWFLFRTWTLR
jgi:Domain of unknown function (DUF4112)